MTSHRQDSSVKKEITSSRPLHKCINHCQFAYFCNATKNTLFLELEFAVASLELLDRMNIH